MIATMLRLSALTLRFVFMFMLARLVSVQDFGAYGLLAATVGYLVYVVGIDFYTYANRELIQSDRSRWGGILGSQAVLACALYVVVLPAASLLCVFGVVPWWLYLWVVLLVPLEHLGIELDRVLISMRKNLYSSIGLFIRQGVAPVLTIGALLLVPEWRTLEFVAGAWVVCDAVGVLTGLILVRRALESDRFGRIDLKWIRRGLGVSLLFLLGTLCLRSFFTVDRQIVAAYEGLETLGAYTLYLSIGAGMTSVVNAGVHQFLYPQLVEAVAAGKLDKFVRTMTRMLVQTLLAIAVISIGALLLIHPLLRFVQNEEYASALWMLPWTLLVVGLYNLALVPHFGLYAFGSDRSILLVTVLATVVFATVLLITVPISAVAGAFAAIGAGSIVLLAGKTIALRRAWTGYHQREQP